MCGTSARQTYFLFQNHLFTSRLVAVYSLAGEQRYAYRCFPGTIWRAKIPGLILFKEGLSDINIITTANYSITLDLFFFFNGWVTRNIVLTAEAGRKKVLLLGIISHFPSGVILYAFVAFQSTNETKCFPINAGFLCLKVYRIT